MSGFADRFEYIHPTFDLKAGEMPEQLRNGLWDAICLTFFEKIAKYDICGTQAHFTDQFLEITSLIWFIFFRRPIDTRNVDAKLVVKEVRHFFFNAKFFEIYNFVEFLARSDVDYFNSNGGGEQFAAFCNKVLARERAAFRFAGTTLVMITDENERRAVADAMSKDVPSAIRTHINRAAELYSDHLKPDYRNSIKESISAVEASVAFATDAEKVHGVAPNLRKAMDRFSLHPALIQGFEKLYAYTSDENGIRHAIMNDRTVTQAEAKYFLVSCSAFSNYLVALKSTHKL